MLSVSPVVIFVFVSDDLTVGSTHRLSCSCFPSGVLMSKSGL